MTCSTGDVDSCEFPPGLEVEKYTDWAKRVLVQSRGITIPTVIDPQTLLPSFHAPAGALAQCFPCNLAQYYNHYDNPPGTVSLDDISDYYCRSDASPPVSCTVDQTPQTREVAGEDVQMVGEPEACLCRTGHYSANYDGTSDYKQKLPGGLDCQPCPAGFSCRFRADTADTQNNTSCAVNQQKCPCPVGYYCPATVGTNIAVPILCDTGACSGSTPARTWCTDGNQEGPSTCIQCFKCRQMTGSPTDKSCLSMLDMGKFANSSRS